MQKYQTKSPLKALLPIPIQLVIDALLLGLALFLDIRLYDPPEGMLGTPFPVFFILAFLFLSVITLVVTLVSVIIMIVRLVNRSREKKALSEASVSDEEAGSRSAAAEEEPPVNR